MARLNFLVPLGQRRPQQSGMAVDASMGGLDSGQYQSLALLNALSQIQQAGLQRTATPMGSIAQNLAPLFGAIIQAKGMEAQAKAMQVAQQLKMAELASKIDPEKRAAEIKHLESLASSEQALAEERKGKQQYRDQQSEMIQKILSGQGGADTSGMKPKITYGPSGPSVSLSSDVLSPEAVRQRKEIAAAGKETALVNAERLAQFKANLPKALSNKDKETLASGDALVSLLDQADSVVGTIPKDISRADYAKNMGKYQTRSEHPLVANALATMTGGLVNTDTDPRLDPMASYIGQLQSALASWSVQNQRGGIRMLNYLKDHFPNYADSPEQVRSKVAQLRKDSSYIKTQIGALNQELHRAGSIADTLPPEIGAQPIQGKLRVPWVDKNGIQHFMMIDPTTGAAVNAD